MMFMPLYASNDAFLDYEIAHGSCKHQRAPHLHVDHFNTHQGAAHIASRHLYIPAKVQAFLVGVLTNYLHELLGS